MTTDPFMQPTAASEPGEIVNGRYSLPHPVTGLPHSWMRTTNFISKIADKHAIDEWEKQTIVAGLALREDYYVEACGVVDFYPDTQDLTKESKQALNEIIERAREAAGGNTGARLGTAVHNFTEQAKRDGTHRAPKKWQGTVDTYLKTLRDFHLTPCPELLERKVVNLRYNLAGTFDDGLLTRDGKLVVGDTKTQKGIYSYCSPAMQLGVYVNADAMWNAALGEYEEMPPFEKDLGILLWTPVRGAYQGSCEPHWVDIKQGYEAVELAHLVYEWQKKGKRKNAIGGLYIPPKSLSKTEEYARRLRDADSVDELSAVYIEASSRALWSPELEQVGKLRQKDLVSTVDTLSTVN